MLRHKNKTSKKPPPTTPPSHKLITNKSARMKYQRRKTVPTLRKLVSDGREVSTGDAQSRGANRAKQDRQRGTTGAKGHAGAGGGGKRTRVAGPGGEDGAERRRAGQPARGAGRASWEHPAACRAPRVPADLQRAQDPAPTAGQRRLRPGQGSRTRRRGRFLSGPGAEGPEPGRGVESRAGQ